MIRDPSDGSVREKPEVGIPATAPPAAKPGMPQSGLPPLTAEQAGEAARLVRSREWLKEYRAKPGKQEGKP
jgi:hypothetical protein